MEAAAAGRAASAAVASGSRDIQERTVKVLGSEESEGVRVVRVRGARMDPGTEGPGKNHQKTTLRTVKSAGTGQKASQPQV